MDDASLSGLIVIALLIVINAILVMAQAATVNVRIGQVKEDAENDNPRAEKLLSLIASNRMTVTFQTVNVLMRFIIASVAMLNVALPIIAANPSAQPIVIYVVVGLVTVFFTLVLGDIVPEAVGSSYAHPLAYTFTGFLDVLLLLFSPLVFALLRLSQVLSGLFKSDTLVNTITEEEIMTLIDGYTGGAIEEGEKEMIYSVLQLDQTRVSEVMVPRIDIAAVEIDETLDEAGGLFVNSGFSRIPVYEENIDNIKGLLYAKDLLAHWNKDDGSEKVIRDLMRSVFFVPETKRVDELLKELQLQKVHMAIVLDEYGGTAGVVTIENIIEEIIGDIQDEYDLHEEADYEQLTEDEYHMDASIDLDDLNHLLDIDLPTEASDTLGGYIYTHLGRVPIIGEIIETEDVTIHVLSVDGRRIRKVHVTRKRHAEESEERDDQTGDNDDDKPDEQISKAG